MKRAVHLFPDTGRHPVIELLRSEYDSLSPFIPAHVTLVFPFESSLEDADLVARVRQIAGHVAPFPFTVGAPVLSEDGYCWLPIESEQISGLHRALTACCCEGYLPESPGFQPHITVARPPLSVADRDILLGGGGPFPLTLEATEITIERFGDDRVSQIIAVIPLVAFNRK